MTISGGIVELGKNHIMGEQSCDHLMPNISEKTKKLHGSVTINLEVKIEQPCKLVIHGAGNRLAQSWAK